MGSNKKKSQRCGTQLCCGSRLSVSSTSSSDSGRCIETMSNYFTHALVQARLQEMIIRESMGSNERRRRCRSLNGGDDRKCLILMAMNVCSFDPKDDFRSSIRDVITCKGLKEPNELRSLLNCYISVNPPELRQAILEAFYEVCCSLFT
ncbi:Ovate protein family C-terminal protein [Dioscorea alata]|uniref:Ovate protein family C-terminal protein n=1 Tax=Dioscorea alata TaxID=55571 RepID=A0ACB7VKB9_DIOAL|nr:Ovate protein family C-terminal protein [Dioscorea alata]